MVTAVGAQEASCTGGRRSEQITGTLVGGRRWSWEEEAAGSWVGGQGSPAGQGASGTAGTG